MIETVTYYKNAAGKAYPTAKEAQAKESEDLFWRDVSRVQDLMDDGGDMNHRFISAGAVALWIVNHKDQLVKVLTNGS